VTALLSPRGDSQVTVTTVQHAILEARTGALLGAANGSEVVNCQARPAQEERQHAEEDNGRHSGHAWPSRPHAFGDLLLPVEAAQYLRLDETGTHTPQSAIRTLNYWRDRGELKATKYARRIWFRRSELDRFLERKTEE